MKKAFVLILTFSVSYILNSQTPVDANNQFAIDLLKQLGNQDKNTFFSPYSISTSLSMTAAGARGETEKQMLKVLHLKQNGYGFHMKYAAHMNGVVRKQHVELSVANSIWRQKGLPLTKEYQNILNQAYIVELKDCDFALNPNGEALKINKWVEDKTKNKVKNIIKPDVLDASTRLVLANAIYFFGQWKTSFDSAGSAKAPFYKNDASQVEATYMSANYSMDYASDELFKVISIPYKNNEVSMLVFLPNHPDSFNIALKKLDFKRYTLLKNALKPEKVKLALPKFKIESEYQLQNDLPKMGMQDAFSGKADFSGITGDKSLVISKVIHKAFVDVSEKGTEAAAATVVIMSRNGGSHKPIEFRADHPFIFMIKDTSTGQLLFIGILNDPKG